MAPPFDIAGGSIVGDSHIAAGRNNQDAYAWSSTEHGQIAVVCDGCGSAMSSDVGAKLGARLMVAALRRHLREEGSGEDLLEQARVDVLAELRTLTHAMADGAYAETVLEHFLFTIVGVIACANTVTTFSLGDGLIVVNGEARVLGPYDDNQPPYLGYALLDERIAKRGFDVSTLVSPDDVRSILIGTDGVLDLEYDKAPSDLAQFWKDDRVFRNTDMVRRRLTLLRRARQRAAAESQSPLSRLADDTTLVVLRRSPITSSAA